MNKANNYIKIFDTTLRDGQQTTGVDFSVDDKIKFSNALDELGLDYIEGGWPGSNPTDDSFFNSTTNFKNSSLVAFGMTRRPNTSVSNDPGLNTLINTNLSHGTFDLGLERHAFQISFNVLDYTWNKAKKIIKEKINE